MEAVLASADNSQAPMLPTNLNYQLDPQGSFVTGRTERTSFALVQSASPAGVKQITYNIASSQNGWLDPKSVLLSCNIRNDGALPLLPSTCGAHCLFDSLIVRMSGQEVERMGPGYNRVCEIFTKLSYSPKKRAEMAQLGFGTAPYGTATPDANAAHVPKQIATHDTQRIFMRLDLSSVLGQSKLIPLWALAQSGLQLVLTLAPANEAVITTPAATYSEDYHLEDLRVLFDEITLQTDLQESFLSSMLQGSALKLYTRSMEFHTNYMPADTAGSFTTTMQRAYTRCAALFVLFSKTQTDTIATNGANLNNTHYFPAANAKDFEYYVNIGSRKIPDQNVTGTKEAFYRMQRALGVGDSMAHTGSVTAEEYESNSWMLGLDLEAAGEGLIATGANLSSGSPVQFHFKNAGSTAQTVPRIIQTIAVFERIIEISDTAVQVWE